MTDPNTNNNQRHMQWAWTGPFLHGACPYDISMICAHASEVTTPPQQPSIPESGNDVEDGNGITEGPSLFGAVGNGTRRTAATHRTRRTAATHRTMMEFMYEAPAPFEEYFRKHYSDAKAYAKAYWIENHNDWVDGIVGDE
jgi:hypothetical protein